MESDAEEFAEDPIAQCCHKIKTSKLQAWIGFNALNKETREIRFWIATFQKKKKEKKARIWMSKTVDVSTLYVPSLNPPDPKQLALYTISQIRDNVENCHFELIKPPSGSGGGRIVEIAVDGIHHISFHVTETMETQGFEWLLGVGIVTTDKKNRKHRYLSRDSASLVKLRDGIRRRLERIRSENTPEEKARRKLQAQQKLWIILRKKKGKILYLKKKLNKLKRDRRKQLVARRRKYLAPPPPKILPQPRPASPQSNSRKRKKPPVPLFAEAERKKRKKSPLRNVEAIDLDEPVWRKKEDVNLSDEILNNSELKIQVDPPPLPSENTSSNALEKEIPHTSPKKEIIDLSEDFNDEEDSLPEDLEDAFSFGIGQADKESIDKPSSRAPHKAEKQSIRKPLSYRAPQKAKKVSGTMPSGLFADFEMDDSLKEKEVEKKFPKDDESDDIDDLLQNIDATLARRNSKPVEKDSFSELDSLLFDDLDEEDNSF